jgi:hypothetical protein
VTVENGQSGVVGTTGARSSATDSNKAGEEDQWSPSDKNVQAPPKTQFLPLVPSPGYLTRGEGKTEKCRNDLE